MTDLTSSVYSIIVLSYATLATTSYLFTSAENRALAALKQIDTLKADGCAFMWQEGRPAGAANGAEDPIVKMVSEYDLLTSQANRKIERWTWLQLYLFSSVLIASFLQFFVLMMKMEWTKPDTWPTITICWAVVIGQGVATAAVPLVGLNLMAVRRKLKRLDGLAANMAGFAAVRKMPPAEPAPAVPAPPPKAPPQAGA